MFPGSRQVDAQFCNVPLFRKAGKAGKAGRAGKAEKAGAVVT